MQFLSLSVIGALATIMTTVHAGCYTGGEVGDQANANANIGSICSTQLSGTYDNGVVKSWCHSQGSVRYNFYIYNLKNGQNYMDPNGCAEYMKREIGCTYGGDRTYDDLGWRFIADPNRGSC